MQKPIEICELIPDEHEPWFKPLVTCEVGGVLLATKIANLLQEEVLGEIWLLQEDDKHNPCAVSLSELLDCERSLNTLKEYYEYNRYE